MIVNPVVSVAGAEEYKISADSSFSFPETALPGEFVKSGLYVGRIQSIETEDGKSVPFAESGKLEFICTFVMPKANIVIS